MEKYCVNQFIKKTLVEQNYRDNVCSGIEFIIYCFWKLRIRNIRNNLVCSRSAWTFNGRCSTCF